MPRSQTPAPSSRRASFADTSSPDSDPDRPKQESRHRSFDLKRDIASANKRFNKEELLAPAIGVGGILIGAFLLHKHNKEEKQKEAERKERKKRKKEKEREGRR